MDTERTRKHVAIIGGGPAGLYVMKHLLRSGHDDLHITVFERKERLGEGMPYSHAGAAREHVTNVSGNEVPELETTLEDWMEHCPDEMLEAYGIDLARFHAFKVVPRLLFGAYLADQFALLLERAAQKGIAVETFLQTVVKDVTDMPDSRQVAVRLNDDRTLRFDHVVIATGHHWPATHEEHVKGWYDAPYPPARIALQVNHPVAIKGASLTAIDAIKTLARSNGTFLYENDTVVFRPSAQSPDFRIVLHSRSGLLPAVRFHLDEPGTPSGLAVSQEAISAMREENDGFIPLDLIFEHYFKAFIRERDPERYERIREWNMEQFVSEVLEMRERIDPFQLFRAEFAEAEKSIARRQSIHWKELLSHLSFAMNYPAKYFPAEDMLRLRQTLMPLIGVIIASVPQSSAKEMLALYDAGVLEVRAVGADCSFDPHPQEGVVVSFTGEDGSSHSEHYRTYIDCSGQRHFSCGDFPFKGLCDGRSLSAARLKFRSPEQARLHMQEDPESVVQEKDDYFLKVPGVMINDYFQLLDVYGALNERICIMAVPYIGGYNPDYSGLDFCDAAAERIVAALNQSREEMKNPA